MELCKVRYDGNHYLVSPYKNLSNYTSETLIMFENEDLGLDKYVDKKSYFVNEWARINFPSENKGRKSKDEFEKRLHNELKQIYKIIKENEMNLKDSEINEMMYEAITSEIEFVEFYRLDILEQKEWLINYITKFIINEKENLKNRKSLFKRKALNNDWNYFVTFTYDEKKHNEISFVKTLKKKLQNLHNRQDWLYMGCFERSKTNRLHFHGLIYVPNGKMQGIIREETYYDTNSKKKAVSYINDDFEKKIGRNDFKPISKSDITFFHHFFQYILKYILVNLKMLYLIC